MSKLLPWLWLGLGAGIVLGALGMRIAERNQFVACEVFVGSLAEWTEALGTVGALFWAIWLATAETRRKAVAAKQEGLLLMALVMPELIAMRPTLAEVEGRLAAMPLEAHHVPIFQNDIREVGTLIERITLPRLPNDIHGLAAVDEQTGRRLAVLLSNVERLRVHAKWMRALEAPRQDEGLYADLIEVRDLARSAMTVANTAVTSIQARLDEARAANEPNPSRAA